MAILKFKEEGARRELCFDCKHNRIKLILGMSFREGYPVTGICENPKNDIYYNCVKCTCEDWEPREE